MSVSNFFVVGLNHLTASVPCRERAAVLPDRLPETLSRLMEQAGLEEAVILSTCSRTEVYARAPDPDAAAAAAAGWFIERGGAEVGPAVYGRKAAEAVRHLFRVAAGLDSWIVGESEILGQVRRSYQTALELRTVGGTLNPVFQRALAAGKVVRARTGLQNGIHSIGGAAALLARRIFPDQGSGEVVVFGAGDAAEAVAKHLAAKNFRDITVANRTVERARALAGALGARPASLQEGLARLRRAQAAVFSAASPEILLHAQALSALIHGRSAPLFLLDLGVPRNVDPACACVKGVYLYNLDALKEIVRRQSEAKAGAQEQAEVLAALAAAECVEESQRAEALRAAGAAGRRLCAVRS